MTSPVYVELVNFMAARNPESFVCFELSEMARERLAELKDRWRTGELTAEERMELEQSAELHHLLELAKAEARELLQQKAQPRSPLASFRTGFRPIKIEGEPFSQTIIEGRGSY